MTRRKPAQMALKLDGGAAAEPRGLLPARLLVSLALEDRAKRAEGCRIGDAYAFHYRHVARSKSAADLLRLAIQDFYSGHYCTKRDTRRHVYADIEALRAAYALAAADE